MPTTAAVREQLTRIIGEVVGADPKSVVPSARLGKDLDVDSLSIVEIVEELGQTFAVYIPDDAVNGLVTVQDAINTVIHHDPDVKAPAGSTSVPLVAGTDSGSAPMNAEELEERKRTAWRLARRFAVGGIVLGVILGFGSVALINATGLDEVSMPAAPTPTIAATTPTPTSTPTQSEPSVETTPEPTLTVTNPAVSPGERIRLKGTFPSLGVATLQVQIRDKDGEWDDFPVTTRTNDDGEYTSVIYTTRTGEREIRMRHEATGATTPAVTITIG